MVLLSFLCLDCVVSWVRNTTLEYTFKINKVLHTTALLIITRAIFTIIYSVYNRVIVVATCQLIITIISSCLEVTLLDCEQSLIFRC